jgi:hypothetical protein
MHTTNEKQQRLDARRTRRDGSAFCIVNLGPHRNNIAISLGTRTAHGQFNVWGNSFAAEWLNRKSDVVVDGVPFDLPPGGTGAPDNVRCQGQVIEVPQGYYDWLYLLAASERRAEDEVALHFAEGAVDFEPLRVSDFWAAPPVFGETKAFESPVMHYPHHVQPGVPAMMWCQRVPVTRRAVLRAVRLPRNLAIHIFAATLHASCWDA